MSLSRIVDNMGSEPTAAELRALAAEFRAMENQLKAPISGKKGNGLRDDDKRLVVDAKEGPGAFEDAEKCSFLAARCATMARDLDQGKAWTQLNNIHFSEVKAAVVHTFDNRYFNRDYFFPSKNENGIPIARSDGIKRARELVGGIGTQAALRFGAEVFYLRDNVPTDMANNGHFFAYINQQARKKLALHVIGLIATICTIAALTLALVSGGWIAITALSAAAFILSNTRTIVHSMIGNAGYGWTFASLLPQFLAKRIRPNPQEEAIAQAEQIA
jgi:hypothetical protein